ncbi:uroporphyrinogen decarboxylase family protein [Larkinella soli]|uniref:uroporphyrinogen decarboxylase family protein n=1 Tax=Larkinella soli TaxID=1770527 RepID=UPI000FFB880C|nr:uroporphyrinogen decarboxylase family protein [Larkinella soli]
MSLSTENPINRRRFIGASALAAAAVGTLPKAFAKANPPAKSRRELVMQVLDPSGRPNYVPAAFFLHFPPEQRTGDAAIRAHLDYFRATGMDLMKVQFEQRYPKEVEVKTPADWARIPVLKENWFEPTLYVIRGLVKAAKSEALIIPTMYSHYQMANMVVPKETLLRHVQEDPEAVSRGMENIALSIMNYVRAATRAGVDGFYTCSQGGEANAVADRALFHRVIKSFDMLVQKEVAQLTPVNILHVCDYEGAYGEFGSRFQDYPGQIVSVPLAAEGKPLSLSQAAGLFKRPVMGGLDRHGVLSTGTPADVKKAVEQVLTDAPAHLILGANCTVRTDIPIENLKTAIQTAHRFRG